MTAQQRMGNIAFFMGITSLVMILFGFSLPFAAFGLILALLSRGAEPMQPRAKTGMIISVIGLVIGLAITASSIVLIRSGALEETYEQMQEMLKTDYSGSDTDELMEELQEILGVTAAPDNADSGIGGDGK